MLIFFYGCNDDASFDRMTPKDKDYSGFVYDGPENGECVSGEGGNADNYSRESEGICVIGNSRYQYHYDIIAKYLKNNKDAQLLTGLSENVDNCYDAGLVVAAKNYLLGNNSINVPDPGTGNSQSLEDEYKALSESEHDGASTDSKHKKSIEPFIWKGSTNSSSNSQSVVALYRKNYTGDSLGLCTGVIINEQWILTAAHCVGDMMPSNDQDGIYTCSGCLMAYWTDPNSGNKECITDGIANHLSCQTWKTVTVYRHEDYTGTGDVNDDVGLIYYSSGWNENISNMRLYNGTPSTQWAWYWGYGYSTNSMCSWTSEQKRLGNFDLDDVQSYYVKTDADDDFRFCKGDSGSPWVKWSGNFALSFGVFATLEREECSGGSDCSEGKSCCAAPTGANQKACRVDRKISWIRDKTGLTCPSSTDNGFPFVRCDD